MRCNRCKKRFNRRNTRSKYCSTDCRYFSRMEIDRQIYFAKKIPFAENRICIVCSKEFVAKGSEMSRNKSCSQECMTRRREDLRKSYIGKTRIVHSCGHARRYDLKQFLMASLVEEGKEKLKEYFSAKVCSKCDTSNLPNAANPILSE